MHSAGMQIKNYLLKSQSTLPGSSSLFMNDIAPSKGQRNQQFRATYREAISISGIAFVDSSRNTLTQPLFFRKRPPVFVQVLLRAG